jgi:hypothetical protein
MMEGRVERFENPQPFAAFGDVRAVLEAVLGREAIS